MQVFRESIGKASFKPLRNITLGEFVEVDKSAPRDQPLELAESFELSLRS